jgi:hypothetical protein
MPILGLHLYVRQNNNVVRILVVISGFLNMNIERFLHNMCDNCECPFVCLGTSTAHVLTYSCSFPTLSLPTVMAHVRAFVNGTNTTFFFVHSNFGRAGFCSGNILKIHLSGTLLGTGLVYWVTSLRLCLVILSSTRLEPGLIN